MQRPATTLRSCCPSCRGSPLCIWTCLRRTRSTRTSKKCYSFRICSCFLKAEGSLPVRHNKRYILLDNVPQSLDTQSPTAHQEPSDPDVPARLTTNSTHGALGVPDLPGREDPSPAAGGRRPSVRAERLFLRCDSSRSSKPLCIDVLSFGASFSADVC